MSTLVLPPAWWERQIAGSKMRAVLQRDDGYENVVRVPCASALTPHQIGIAKLLAHGKSHKEIAAEIGLVLRMVKQNIQDGAAKIPGDLPATTRLILWYRGATLQLLTGAPPQLIRERL